MTGILRTTALAVVLLCSTAVMNCANAQDVRYAWFELGVLGQDVQKSGSFFDLGLNQSVDIDASDGGGVRFRGSIGTWKNFYAFFNFETSDPTVEVVVTNNQGEFFADIGSASVLVKWKRCSPSAASRSPMKRFDHGAKRLVLPLLATFNVGKDA